MVHNCYIHIHDQHTRLMGRKYTMWCIFSMTICFIQCDIKYLSERTKSILDGFYCNTKTLMRTPFSVSYCLLRSKTGEIQCDEEHILSPPGRSFFKNLTLKSVGSYWKRGSKNLVISAVHFGSLHKSLKAYTTDYNKYSKLPMTEVRFFRRCIF